MTTAIFGDVTALLTNPAVGRPVALVRVADVGVPSIGVTRVGEVDRTALPDPVVPLGAPVELHSGTNAVAPEAVVLQIK